MHKKFDGSRGIPHNQFTVGKENSGFYILSYKPIILNMRLLFSTRSLTCDVISAKHVKPLNWVDMEYLHLRVIHVK